MGLFTPSPEKKFLKLEKQAHKWPSRYYRDVLDVYLDGTMGVERFGEKGLTYDIIHLPQYKNFEKAAELLREALKSENIKKSKLRFGKAYGGPNYTFRPILALASKSETERRKIVRELIFSNDLLSKPISWYIFTENQIDKYCDSFEEHLQVLYNIYVPVSEDTTICWAEKGTDMNHGFYAWQWRELLKFTKEEEREAAGKKEFEKLLGSEDPDVRNRTRKFLEAKSSKDAKRLKELMNSVMLVQKYEQDNLNVQFVDQHGDKVEIKDDLTVEKM